LGIQPKMGGRFHIKLNIVWKPIEKKKKKKRTGGPPAGPPRPPPPPLSLFLFFFFFFFFFSIPKLIILRNQCTRYIMFLVKHKPLHLIEVVEVFKLAGVDSRVSSGRGVSSSRSSRRSGVGSLLLFLCLLLGVEQVLEPLDDAGLR